MATAVDSKDVENGWADDENGWGPGMRANLDRLSAMAVSAWALRLATTTGLTFGYFGGFVFDDPDFVPAAGGTLLLTDNTTNYVERTDLGVVSVNQVAYTAGRIPLGRAVTSGGSIASWSDDRPAAAGGGTAGPQGDPGDPGADGTPGSVWRDGAGVPANGTGVDGDYYLRSSNGDVYKRAAGTYSVVGNIKGAAGAPGADGNDGAPGADGADGAGVPVGGTAGQVLAKIDGTDFNTEWVAQTGGGGGGGHDGEFDAGQLAALTWVNQDASTAVLREGFIVFGADNVGAEVHMLKKAITTPSGNWIVRCRVSIGQLVDNERGGGLVLRESGTGKLVILIIYKTASSPGEGCYVFSWSDAMTFVASLGTPVNLREDFQLHQAMTLEVEKSGSTLHYRIIPGEGGVGIEVHNQLINVSFTAAPDEFGICGYSNGSAGVPTPMAFKYLEQV